MMLVHQGEFVLATFIVKTKHGKCAIHVSNARILLEEYKLGCIMALSLKDVDSCTLNTPSNTKTGTMITLYHNNGSYAEIHTKDASELVDIINSALAKYKSSLIAIGALTDDSSTSTH